jgi:hydroxymethylglutaryl-CoA lyase
MAVAPFPESVRICEVGPRDGLQNQSTRVPTDQKVAWIDRLSDAGFPYIEVSSFVSPHWIPMLDDADEVFRQIRRRPGVTYAGLVPNMRGLERALSVGVGAVAVFMSASETHNRKNINKSIAQTLPLLREVVVAAKAVGIPVRGYISTAFGCPFEGAVEIAAVRRIALQLLAYGCDELSIGDTIGVAVPCQTQRVVSALLEDIPAARVVLHMHDTRGMALANILVALQQGITSFDAAQGGLGGCPYAPGAAGNVATDDLLYMLHGCNVRTGIDQEAFVAARNVLRAEVGPLSSRAARIEEGKCAT